MAVAASGGGVATHIGRFRVELEWCMDPVTGVLLGGEATAIASNGDEVAMTLAGSAPAPTQLVMEATIVGGTGRFVDATGRLDSTISLDGAGGWSGEGTGWISY
ncbi:MAG TPA: hypothetical protein VK858_02165 [Longimicrobiales bacterium]|nr:hypothetical protein [Longimicrobiales bacterium]